MSEILRPKTQILHLDDNADWREQIGGLLEDSGYSVEPASTANEACELINHKGPFDLAIFDMRLDDSDEKNVEGAELAFKVRDAGHDFPIIILTGYSGNMPAEMLRELGLAPYNVRVIKKDKINADDNGALFYQLESLLPWQKRNISCFVAMPFREGLNDVYEQIESVLSELNIKCIRIDHNSQAGVVPSQILHHLRRDSFVIADLTDLNPNVLYELGYAQALQRHTIILCQDHDEIPPELSPFHKISYNVRYSGLQDLSKSLKNTITATLSRPAHIPRPRNGIPVKPGSYLDFVPKTEIGKLARTEIIDPTIKNASLERLESLLLNSDTLAVEQIWHSILASFVVFAEISEEDPLTYYYVGASDALKGICVFLLIREGMVPPFNLRGRANIIYYDPDNSSNAIKIHQQLSNRIQRCLSDSEFSIVSESQPTLLENQAALHMVIADYHSAALTQIDAHFEANWTAEERAHSHSDIEHTRQFVVERANQDRIAVEQTASQEELIKVEIHVRETGPNWAKEALAKFYS